MIEKNIPIDSEGITDLHQSFHSAAQNCNSGAACFQLIHTQIKTTTFSSSPSSSRLREGRCPTHQDNCHIQVRHGEMQPKAKSGEAEGEFELRTLRYSGCHTTNQQTAATKHEACYYSG